jgi:hypothetical protein
MKLTEDQLNLLFQEYLDTYILPGSSKHHEVFNGLERGSILTKRLKKILRTRELSFIESSNTFNVTVLSEIAQEKLRECKRVYIMGLNHWFTLKDVEILSNIAHKYFG